MFRSLLQREEEDAVEDFQASVSLADQLQIALHQPNAVEVLQAGGVAADKKASLHPRQGWQAASSVSPPLVAAAAQTKLAAGLSSDLAC